MRYLLKKVDRLERVTGTELVVEVFRTAVRGFFLKFHNQPISVTAFTKVVLKYRLFFAAGTYLFGSRIHESLLKDGLMKRVKNLYHQSNTLYEAGYQYVYSDRVQKQVETQATEQVCIPITKAKQKGQN